MANTLLQNKLESLITKQLVGYLDVIAKKHSLDVDTLKNDWSEFTGFKSPKTKRGRQTEGPTLAELKQQCKDAGIASSGNKATLLERLDKFSKGEIKPKHLEQAEKALADGPYGELKLTELREKCTEKGLSKVGNKETLRKRLVDSDSESDSDSRVNYRRMKVGELKKLIKDRKLKCSGNKKEDYINTLINDDDESESESDSESSCSDCDSDSESCSDCETSCSELEAETIVLEKKPKIKTKTKNSPKWVKHSDGTWGPQ